MENSWNVVQGRAGLVLLSVLSLTHGASVLNDRSGLSNYTFPEDFMFGVGTASYQIEGAWNEDGKGESVWDTYLHEHPEFTKDHSNGDVAADSYHKYMDDIRIIKDLGVKFYRMSISWPRLLPNGTDNNINKAGVKYYRTLFEELVKVNITPVVTLFHWDMPTIFMKLGGWTNPVMVDYFVDYARVAFNMFGDIVKMWTTINEPYEAYGGIRLVPALNLGGVAYYLCSHYILLAHARAYRLYDKEFRPHQKGKIAVTLNSVWGEPKDATKQEDYDAVERYLQMRLGMYAHPIYSAEGDYPAFVRERIDNISRDEKFSRSKLPYFTNEEVKALRGSSDFFSFNHYTTFIMSPSSTERSRSVPSMNHDTEVKVEWNPDWMIYPKSLPVYAPGLRKIVNWITKNYGKTVPIVISENGISHNAQTNDYERISFFNDYLNQLLLAIHIDGCNVTGYFAWSLIDNFEWNIGYLAKFGLYSVNFNSPNKTRTPKLSAKNYHEIVQSRRINFNSFKPPIK